MLINKIGIESDEEIVELDSRRPLPDPRNRETMTKLLQAALRPVPRPQLPASRDATVSAIDPPTATSEQSSHTDVA